MAQYKKSKYAITPAQVHKMNENELKAYINSSYKVLQSKVSRIKKTGYARFSNIMRTYDQANNRTAISAGAQTSRAPIGRTKGKTLLQLRATANEISRLMGIEETPAQLKIIAAKAETKIQELMSDKIFSSKSAAAFRDLIGTDEGMRAFRDWVDENLAEYLGRVGSDPEEKDTAIDIDDIMHDPSLTLEDKYLTLFKEIQRTMPYYLKAEKKEMPTIDIKVGNYKGKVTVEQLNNIRWKKR